MENTISISNSDIDSSEVISISNSNQESSNLSQTSKYISSNSTYPKKTIENKIETFLIEKVDVVYLNMKNETKYHRNLKIILFLFSIISYSFLVNTYFMFSVNRQNVYCFNTSYNQFEMCSLKQLCENFENGVSILMYDNSNLSNTTDINNEILKVNKKYNNFFYENVVEIFSRKTYSKVNDFSQFMKKFNGGVILTENELPNISLKYNDICNQSAITLIYGIFIFMGIMCGNILLTVCADIIGRRKIMILSIATCAICCIGVFILMMRIDSDIERAYHDFKFENNRHYSKNHIEIINQYYLSQQTKLIFKKFKIILALFFFIIHFTNTSAQNASLTLLVENSINDSLVLKNYWMYNNGIILSILYAYITVYIFNDSKYYFLINGLLLILILILILVYVRESPRQFYEFSEWIPYTQFFNHIITEKQENIKSLFVSQTRYDEMRKVENQVLENKRMTLKNTINAKLKRNSVFEIIQQHLAQIRESVKKGDNLIFKRKDVKTNPFILITCLAYEKIVRENTPIIWAYLICVFFINNAVLNGLFARYFFTRVGLFEVFLYNSSFLHICIVFMVSNGFFYIFLQFFGFKRTLTVCFIGVFFSCLLVDLPSIDNPRYLGDLNRYNYTLMPYYYSDTLGKGIRASYFVLGFFTWGINFATFIYIFKYTKTIYRCTFFGLIDILNKCTFFSIGLIQITYNSRIILITSITSILGLFTIIFLNDKDEDHNIIYDKRKFDNIKNK